MGTAQTGQELHCVLDSLDYKNTTMVVLSGTRPVRFYFKSASTSASDTVITGGTGSNAVYHCNTVSVTGSNTSSATVACSGADPGIRDLALFGCNSCGSQYIDLKGNTQTLKMFAYFPNGNFTLSGNPQFEGVLWANTIQSSGNVTWTVPSAGLLDIHDYMGFVPKTATDTTPASKNWFLYDYTARAVTSFSWRTP